MVTRVKLFLHSDCLFFNVNTKYIYLIVHNVLLLIVYTLPQYHLSNTFKHPSVDTR